MSSQAHHIRRLAKALVAGPLEDREALVARAKPLVGDLRKARWLTTLARNLSLEFAEAPRPTWCRIADRIRTHEGFVRAWAAGRGRISIALVMPQMAPAAGAPQTWGTPPITTLEDLATTLRLHPDDLGWLISRGQAEHYRHRWQAKLVEKALTWQERRRLATPHLPQGAPTSPTLANLSAFRLDCRLAGLARAAGADYTRYADDLLFSGGLDFARQSRRFEATVGAILIEEGFRPNHHKTRVLRKGAKQHAAGLVLNGKPNIDRRDFDRLKAVLTNCARHGPASQNREGHPDFAAHLMGKLAWVGFVHPGKEAKLRRIFDRINWS